MESVNTHRIIVNEHGQLQVTRLGDKSLIHSSPHFNKCSCPTVVYCEHPSDETAVEMGCKMAKEKKSIVKPGFLLTEFGKKGAASHLFSFAIAAYFLVTIFLILVVIVR